MYSFLAAAEIAETYPDKHVILVQSGKVLVPGYGARFSRRILEILRGLHVEVGSAFILCVASQTKNSKSWLSIVQDCCDSCDSGSQRSCCTQTLVYECKD